MSIPTLCLSLLCLLLMVYPGALPSIISNMIYTNRKYDSTKKKNSFWLLNVGSYILICILIVVQPGYDLKVLLPEKSVFYLIGLLLGVLLVGFELLAGAGFRLLLGKKVGKLTVDERIGKESTFVKMSVFLVAMGEEIVFRSLGYEVICEHLMLSEACFVVISAALYGINHIHEGFEVFIEKLLTGALLGTLFLISGKSVIAPLIAHVLENVIITVWSKRAYE